MGGRDIEIVLGAIGDGLDWWGKFRLTNFVQTNFVFPPPEKAVSGTAEEITLD